jgi:hypothetical protein
MIHLQKHFSLFLLAILSPFIAFSQVACTQAQIQQSMTVAQAGAWSIANGYETVNTQSGGLLTKSLLDAALKATHNTPDTALVETAGQLADAAINAQLAAKKAGATNAGQQAAVTTVLSDPGVINKAAAAAPSTLQVPVGTVPIPINTGS